LFVIGSNFIFLALDKEVAILTANGSNIDFAFLILYSGEMVLKIIAKGFFLDNIAIWEMGGIFWILVLSFLAGLVWGWLVGLLVA